MNGYSVYTTTKLPMTNSNPKQHKQRYYYIFWSLATLSVIAGQIYIANSYRYLASLLKQAILN